jgi:cytochrome c
MNKMKSVLMAGASLALALTTQAVRASPELAKSKNCMTCHAPATKVIGPSFKDIAARYGSDPEAETRLTTKVRKGSSGVWGPVPMPANAQVNEDEARTLVKWILTQK